MRRFQTVSTHCAAAPSGQTSTSRQPSIADALSAPLKDDLDVVLSRLVAVDKLSFHTLATSQDLQEGLRARGFKVLKSSNQIRERVSAFTAKTREKLRTELRIQIEKGGKICSNIR